MKNEKTNIAYVTFKDEDCVEASAMFNGTPLLDVEIIVAPAD